MVEANLEQRIITALDTAMGDLPHRSIGSWQFAKALEREECDTLLEVKVAPRTYEIETTPCAAFRITFRIISRRETDVDVMPFLEAVTDKLDEWQRDYDTAAASLDGGDFSFAGFVLTGGTFERDPDSSAYVWEQTATIRGVIISTTNQEGD